MKRLRKKDQLTVRFTSDQLGKIRRAARVESGRRGEIVEPGTLIRELVLPPVERILADAEQVAA